MIWNTATNFDCFKISHCIVVSVMTKIGASARHFVQGRKTEGVFLGGIFIVKTVNPEYFHWFWMLSYFKETSYDKI